MESRRFSRILQLINDDDFAKVKEAKLIIFGVGGVGGQALESLVRSGFSPLQLLTVTL